jgi:hypothetical protein
MKRFKYVDVIALWAALFAAAALAGCEHMGAPDTSDTTPTTPPAEVSTWGISLSQSAAYDFSAEGGPYYSDGYTQPAALTVTITNTGTQATGVLSISLTGADADSFTLSDATISAIAAEGSASFTVQPKAGLTAAQTYQAAVEVSGGNGIYADFAISFTVTAAGYAIALSQTSAYDFGTAVFLSSGYTQPAALTVTITNTGTQATGVLSISLTGADADSFTLSDATIPAIAAEGSASFTVQPKAGLTAAQTYEAAVKVSGGSIHTGFEVTFSLEIWLKSPDAVVVDGTIGLIGVIDVAVPVSVAGYSLDMLETTLTANNSQLAESLRDKSWGMHRELVEQSHGIIASLDRLKRKYPTIAQDKLGSIISQEQAIKARQWNASNFLYLPIDDTEVNSYIRDYF